MFITKKGETITISPYSEENTVYYLGKVSLIAFTAPSK